MILITFFITFLVNFENSSIESLKELLFTLKWPLLYNDWNEPYQKIFYWLDWEIQIARMGLSPVFLITELTLDMRNFSSAYISVIIMDNQFYIITKTI